MAPDVAVVRPPTEIASRSDRWLYLGAAVIVLIGLAELALGYWGFAAATFAMAGLLGSQPRLRRDWFTIGWNHGYINGYQDGTEDARRAGGPRPEAP